MILAEALDQRTVAFVDLAFAGTAAFAFVVSPLMARRFMRLKSHRILSMYLLSTLTQA